MFNNHLTIALTLVFVFFFSQAYAGCPSGSYRGLFGKCMPEIGGTIGQATEHAKNEIKGQTLGPVLEFWINESRRTSINGAQPIPPNIRQALTGYIDEDSMNRAKFKVGDSGVLNLAGLTVKYGDVIGGEVGAITLNDVIVFRDAFSAYNDVALWAHELTHVGQYRDKGVHGFSIAYMRRSWDMEGPAYAKGDQFLQWAANHNNLNAIQALNDGPHGEWIGIAFNNKGNFAVMTSPDGATAETLALNACNQNYGDCYPARTIPGNTETCFSMVRDGNDLYGNVGPDVGLTGGEAMQACTSSNDPGPGCEVILQECNNPLREVYGLRFPGEPNPHSPVIRYQ